ncbi:RND family efflux transporter, MFP subunit [Rubidibacter lacunae KORDI 51-2]|uniref:RND family efflux transporter, MFP subunit n=1 Tax=Rubidibacter lacunae KORDI 51-2 TaxID=582515 RepID=U5DNW9_9CHRO|nr:efflux RND transporter periplasmic adaptor subunit [Rubidibacter lacunae]ERN42552.1 RND family efflux transporter, MFP subunit [Rubidibacter lacunae KORDI 51-2]
MNSVRRTVLRLSLRPFAIGAALSAIVLSAACSSEPKASAPPPVRVTLAAVSSGTIETSSRFVGNLEATELAVVRSEIQGRIVKVTVQDGQSVQPGTVLLEIEPDQTATQLDAAIAQRASAEAVLDTARQELRVSEAELATAASNLELKEVNFARAEFLVEQGAIGEIRYDQASQELDEATNSLAAAADRVEAARAQIAQAEAGVRRAEADVETQRITLGFKTVTAPISGILDDILVKVGDFLNVGDAVVTVAENRALDLRIQVPSNRSGQLREGLIVELYDPASNKQIGEGIINFIAPTVNSDSQLILTKARFFPGTDGKLRDGQYVQARIIWETGPGLLVPTIAITRISGRSFAFVAEEAEGQPVVVQKLVELGDVQGDSFQVVSGLEAGDRVAVSNILRLRDGAPIQETSAQEAGSQTQSPAASQTES